MSGGMRRIGEYLGLLEDTGRYDDEYGSYEGEYDTQETMPVSARPVEARGPSCARLRPVRAPAYGARPGRCRWPSCPASPPCTRAPTTRRARSARTSATAPR